MATPSTARGAHAVRARATHTTKATKATKAKAKAQPKAKAKATKAKKAANLAPRTIIEYLLPVGGITDEDVIAGFNAAERAILAELPTLVRFLTVMLNAQRFGATIHGPRGVARHLKARKHPTAAEGGSAYHAVAAVLAHDPSASLSHLALVTGYSRPYVCKLRTAWRAACEAANAPVAPDATPDLDEVW